MGKPEPNVVCQHGDAAGHREAWLEKRACSRQNDFLKILEALQGDIGETFGLILRELGAGALLFQISLQTETDIQH